MADDYGAISHLLLQATDLDRSASFYTDVVGFHVKERTSLADDRPLIVFHERMGLTQLPEDRAERGQAVEHIAFRVSDVHALYETLQANDVTIDAEPNPTPYGTSVYFFDPDGNRIECHD